jgi:hypothetical protein
MGGTPLCPVAWAYMKVRKLVKISTTPGRRWSRQKRSFLDDKPPYFFLKAVALVGFSTESRL